MELEELKEFLYEQGYENTVFFENPSYTDAIIGVTKDGNLCYSYKKMIQYLVDTDNMEAEEAIEFIDYNTIRALPYANSYGVPPIVVYDDIIDNALL